MSDELEPWPLAGYAPGNYSCKCITCGNDFDGDKRAIRCLECAVITAKARIAAAVSPDVDGLVAELEAGLKDVTPGPWSHYCAPLRKGLNTINEVQDADGKAIVQWAGFDNSDRTKKSHKRNAAHIARCSPDNIRRLIAALRSRPVPTDAVEADRETIVAQAAAKICEAGALCGWPKPECKSMEAAEALFDAGLLRAALSAHTGGDGWQPIETAPKDGTLILLLGGGAVALGKWWPEGNSWVDQNGIPDADCYRLSATGVWESEGGWFQPNEVSGWSPIPPALQGASK